MQRADLERAFTQYRVRVEEISRSGHWGGFADLFTPEVCYRRNGYSDVVGREALRAWVLTSMTTFPGTLFERHDVVWRTFDPAHDRVVYELRHTLRDPGDGSEHTASCTTLLRHGEDGLWSYAEDNLHALAYRAMWRGWGRAALRCGNLDPEQATTIRTLTGESSVTGVL